MENTRLYRFNTALSDVEE